MSLRDLLDPDFLVPALAVTYLIRRVELNRYAFFEKKFSFSKEDFKDAQFWESYMDENSNKESSEYARQNAIKKYKSVVDEFVPKSFLLSSPFFYFKVKKELSSLQKESERRLEELKAA